MTHPLRFLAILCFALTITLQASITDLLMLGDTASEKAHAFEPGLSESLIADHGQPARRLLPLDPPAWNGGSISFTLKIDPEKPNYFTAKFSGDEVTENRLMLYADGLQIGYRHLGDIEQLDFGTHAPAYAGRFYYNTSPLPLELTRGKTELRFEIRSSGRVWGYGHTFERYQKDMVDPSRSIFRVYTHTDGCFIPPADEVHGQAPVPPAVTTNPGPEILDQVKSRVNGELNARLAPRVTPNQMQLQLIAKAYDVEWTVAHRNPAAISQIIKGLDALYAAYLKNPKLAQADPATWNPEWFGLGVCGQVIALRIEQLAPSLEEPLDNGQGGRLTRRAAYTDMLVATRDWHRLNRRLYTNQSMINDLNGIYLANRGLQAIAPARALPEPEALRYLYESVGLIPWTDSDAGGRQWNAGPGYYQLTAKGLTKEIGYVGSYGEVIDLVSDIYEATRPAPGQPGDAKIREQLVKIALARSIFRHPALDASGNPAMRLEQVVGWRDSYHPGYVVYAQRATRDASALQAAAITQDPRLVGYAKQMLADNQFFASEREAMNDRAQPLRTTIGRLDTPAQLALIESLPDTGHRLPMGWDQPDFVWTDEENGVLALKRGREILYASLYWRARYAINNLARVHHLTPDYERIAVVRQQTEFTPHGQNYTRPDHTNFGFGNGGLRYPGELRSAHAGEVLPIARVPAAIPFRPGQENSHAGRGDFYTLRYGPYLIAMNMSADRTFELTVPSADFRNLSDERTPSPDTPLSIAPRSSVVLHLAQ